MISSKMIGLIKLFSLFFLLILTNQCSENKNEKVSKGHREAIANECSEDRDKKLCGLEVRKSFIESGNDFVTFFGKTLRHGLCIINHLFGIYFKFRLQCFMKSDCFGSNYML